MKVVGDHSLSGKEGVVLAVYIGAERPPPRAAKGERPSWRAASGLETEYLLSIASEDGGRVNISESYLELKSN